MLKKDLVDFVKRFETPEKLKKDLKSQALDIISRYKIPERYLEGFKGEELLLRKMELVQKKRQSPKERLSPLKTDVKTRERFQSGEKKKVKSNCIKKMDKLAPNVKMSEFKKLSNKTGVPVDIIEKVNNKGMGAFASSGSRPGMTSKQWGLARLACFLSKKSTVVDGPDKHLYEDAIKRSSKAKKYFSNIKTWK